MKFFYSAGAMGYGDGWWWHKFFNFPKLPFVTKTLTLYPKKGYKYLIIPNFRGSVYNHVALANIGLFNFKRLYGSKVYNTVRTISIAGGSSIAYMISIIDNFFPKKDNIELNFSCPNVKSFENKYIPKTNRKIYLKLNYKQNPYDYNLDRVYGIRLNSIPLKHFGGSGKIAQEKNWKFIYKYNKDGLNVAGCSARNFDDVGRLEGLGCTEIGIGSATLTNPFFVKNIRRLEI